MTASDEARVSLQALLDACANATVGDLSARVPVEGDAAADDPFTLLANALNILLRDLEEREARAREEVKAREEAWNALRASDARLRTLIDQSPYSIQTLDLDGRVTYGNPAWARLFGVRVEDVRDYSILRDPQLEAAGAAALVRRAFAGESVVLPRAPWRPDRGARKDEELWTQATLYPLLDDEGRVTAVVLMHEDITERVRAERERDAERVLLKTVVEQMPSGVMLTSPTGEVILKNRRVDELAGGDAPTPGSLDDYAAWSGFHADGRPIAPHEWPLARALLHGEVVRGEELRVLTNDGRYRWLRVNATPIRGPEARVIGAVAVFDDVTREKDASRELDAARLALARAERQGALGTLVSGVAHEIRTPLTAIRNTASLAARFAKRRTDLGELGDLVAELDQHVERIDALVEDLRRFTRAQLLGTTVGGLEGPVGAALKLFGSAHRGEAPVRVTLDATPPVHHDPARIQQIVINLVENAVDATRGRGNVHVRTGGDERGAFLVVEDDGPGIPPDVRARVFDEFFTTKPHGTGLGLSIVRRIAHEHGGGVSLESEADRGTRVTVRFPPAAKVPLDAPAIAPAG